MRSFGCAVFLDFTAYSNSQIGNYLLHLLNGSLCMQIFIFTKYRLYMLVGNTEPMWGYKLQFSWSSQGTYLIIDFFRIAIGKLVVSLKLFVGIGVVGN